MKKQIKYEETKQQFQNFLKNGRASQELFLKKASEIQKKAAVNIESKELKQKNQSLQKKCYQFERTSIILKAEVKCFKEKTLELLNRCKDFEQAFENIINFLMGLGEASSIHKTYFDLSVDSSEQPNIKQQYQFIISSLESLSPSANMRNNSQIQISCMQCQQWKKLQNEVNQLKVILGDLERENQGLKIKLQTNSELLQKYKQNQTLLSYEKEKLTQKLTKFEEEEKNYLQLITNLQIKTKNRSEVILIFKGLVKKQRDHENICPLYKNQNNRVSADQLQQYEKERKKYFTQNKKKLTNILQFQT